MPMARSLGIALLLACVLGEAAAEPASCLNQEQRRAAIAGRQAIPLGKALEAVRAQLGGEVLRARLCHHERGLVYVLTVLAHDGKVTRAIIDGTSGALIHR
jgi:uncharacterized membrane protein YkoI